MKEINSMSMIVVASCFGLATLGFLGYSKVVSYKKKTKKKETPQPSVEASKTETVNEATNTSQKEPVEIYNATNTTANRLVEGIITDLLNKNDKFKGPDHFMGEFVRIAIKNIIDPRWFDELPKDTNELNNLIKTYDRKIYRLYERKVLGIGFDNTRPNSHNGKKVKKSTLHCRVVVLNLMEAEKSKIC